MRMVLVGLMLLSTAVSAANISEVVYVDTGLDTDKDGKSDLMYVSVYRPQSDKKLSTIYTISPYALGGQDVPMHNVDSDILPQDEKILGQVFPNLKGILKGQVKTFKKLGNIQVNAPTYARVSAHSIGTGNSTGCPSVGD